MDLLVGLHAQHMTVCDADQIEIVHECAECERLLFSEGKVESIGDQRRIEADTVSVIEQMATFGF